MSCKVFPSIDIRGDQDRPRWICRPLLPVKPLARPMVSRWLTEVPVKFHHGVVTFGVVGLSLPLVSVKLTDIQVPLIFLS